MNGLVAVDPVQLVDALGLIVFGCLACSFVGAWLCLMVRDLVLSVERALRQRAAAKPFRERVECAREVSMRMRDLHARRVRRLTGRLYPPGDDCPF